MRGGGDVGAIPLCVRGGVCYVWGHFLVRMCGCCL